MVFPIDTPISEMGLSPDEASILTPKASRVTKQQILILHEIARTHEGESEAQIVSLLDERTGLSLDIDDVSSIASAFDRYNERRASSTLDRTLDANVSCCCCCTPCCSCTASVVIEPAH